MCAPGGQRESRVNQREQPELNVLQCPGWADVSGGKWSRSASRQFAPVIAEGSVRGMSGYGMGLSGVKRTWASISAMSANDPGSPRQSWRHDDQSPPVLASKLSAFPHRAPACPHVSKQPISQRPDHLNCGIGGTVMRGGGIGATAGAFCSPIWPCICAEPIKAPLAANPAEPPAEPRANAAAGNARTTRIKAIFVAVFDIGSLHLNLPERRSAWCSCRSRSAVGH